MLLGATVHILIEADDIESAINELSELLTFEAEADGRIRDWGYSAKRPCWTEVETDPDWESDDFVAHMEGKNA